MSKILELFKESQELMGIQNEYTNSIALYESRIKELKTELEEINERLSQINDEVKFLSQKIPSEKSGPQLQAYDSGWSNVKKAIWALRSNSKTMTIRRIVDFIAEHDSNIKHNAEANRSLMSTMSSTISTKAKKGMVFKRYTEYEGGEWLYGLRKWFGEDGKIKQEYNY